MDFKYLEQVLDFFNIKLNKNIYPIIELNNIHANNHISLLIDSKTKEIICYGTNYLLKQNKFLSIHAEIDNILKYYKNKHKLFNKRTKILIIIKISKTGIIGMSKPCRNCIKFIKKNYDKLKIVSIYYTIRFIKKKIIKNYKFIYFFYFNI
jgi:hypothetical protein